MKTKIPKLRFIEFKDAPAWEEEKLGEVSVFLKDGTHATHPNDENSEYKLLSAKNIINNSIKIFEDDRSIAQSEYESIYKNYKLEKNDILLTIVGTIGRTALYKCEEKIAFQRSVAFIRTSENQYFINHILNNTTTKNQLDKFTSISAQPGVYLSDLKKVKFTLPSSSEQEKIGKFLSTLDKRIKLQEKLIEKLEDEKKWYLQKLFPKKGKSIPELRFEEFKDSREWNANSLDEFFSKITNTIKVNDNVKYQQLTISANGYIERRGEKYGCEIGRKRQFVVDSTRDILSFTRQGVYDGAIGFIDKKLYGSIVTENMPLLEKNENLDIQYFSNYLCSPLYNEEVLFKLKPTGSAQASIHEKDWLESQIIITTLPEQVKIGKFFHQLNSDIDRNRILLEKIKEIKSGYTNDILT